MKYPLARLSGSLAIVVVILLFVASISAESKAAHVSSVGTHSPTIGAPLKPVTGTLPNSPLFWDASLKSNTLVSANDQSMIIPDPDDEVRLIVQLDDEPLAGYVKRTFAPTRHLSADDLALMRRYADRLAESHRQTLAEIDQRGIAVKVNRQFRYLVNGLSLSVKLRDWQP